MRHHHRVEVLLLWLTLLVACGVVADQMTRSTAVDTPVASPVVRRTRDPQRGAALFAGTVEIAGFVACRGCHAVDPAASDSLGPNLAGIALRAGSRISGIAADVYIRRSIEVHDDFVVPGFEAGLARAVVGRDFGEILSDQDIADLTAYLLTLDQAPVAQAPTPDSSSAPTPSPEPATVTAAPAASPLPATTAAATLPPTPMTTVEPSPVASPSPSPGNRALTTVSPTIMATETPHALATLSPTAAIPTVPPTPTDAAAPSPAPPANTPPASGADGSLPAELAVYTGCMTCHDQHPQSVVRMPHVRFPQCSACHSGSPSRVGCPTCHSMHRIEAPHGGENPNLPCSHCHADR